MTMESQTINTKRRGRFARHRFGKPMLVLQPRDLEIVRVVSQHRVIASDDLQLLIPGSDQSILRRLQKLFHNGYLDRPRSQRQLGNAPMVYALGQQGAELLARKAELRSTTDWTEKNRQISPFYLEHALMVSRFQAALRHASISADAVVERWQGDGAVRKAVHVENENGVERIPVAPDAYFVIRVIGGERPGRIHCFLEADRGTMTVARFLTKLRGYFAFWKSGQAEEHFGMRNFLVVTTTGSQARTDHLLEACRQVSDRGLRMFVFASEADYLPVSDRKVLGSIWRTPADEVEHSLLE